jgi:nucleoside-diphosphate-sugar epimerase
MNRHLEDVMSKSPITGRQPTALVIGATGGIGGELTRAALARGYRVRALSRRPAEAARDFASLGAVEWVKGDAMNEADVVAAADGASLIVHGANPPGYKNWKGLALPMLQSTIAAAKASGARILFPGTVYNFGPDAFPVLTEASPKNPKTRKGAIRVMMERRLEAAAGEGARCIVVRAGDFFGPRTGNSWFAQGIVKGGQPVRSVAYPGVPEVGHAWAYVPDLAETMMRLASMERSLADFEVVHFRGHWLERGVEMAEAVRRVVGRPDLPIRAFPWAAVYLAAPFVTVLRETLEMRYLWKVPVKLDNSKLLSLLGEEPHTPLDEAVRSALEGLGCLAKAEKRAA